MGQLDTQRFCKHCRRKTLHRRTNFEFRWGCLLSIFTGGLFLLIWPLIKLREAARPWRCQRCGKARLT